MLFFSDMGEAFRGGGEFSLRVEREPEVETKERLDDLNRLLARLVETGGDLPSDVKRGLRGQIQGLLQVLGLKSLKDYAGWAELYQRLYEPLLNLPAPKNYPSEDEFKEDLHTIFRERHMEGLPRVPRRPRATQVAQFARASWEELNSRGGVGAVDYLYELGKVMSSEAAYTTIFGESDLIEVGERWSVENGRHRALTLRALGSGFVRDSGMDRWVLVQRE